MDQCSVAGRGNSRMTAKKPPGEPRKNKHVPTDDMRSKVEGLTAVGIRRVDLADVLGVSTNTLERHYARELRVGLVKANAKVAETLFNKAINGDTTSIIFWLKTRARWSTVEHLHVEGSVSQEEVQAPLMRSLNTLDVTQLKQLHEIATALTDRTESAALLKNGSNGSISRN